jgi:Zn-dependent protease with chaperone function
MIQLSATYYDGQSSKPREVVVRAQPSGPVRIEGLESPLEIAWADVRISPRLGNTVRSLSFPGGAKCETSDNEAVDALERLTARGARRALIHRLESRWQWALAAVALVAVVTVVGFTWGIPWLARHVAKSVPDELAYDLGRGALATLDQTVLSPTKLATSRQAELRRELDRVAAHYPQLPLRLEFRHADFPNAFALPDGTVVVTDALVNLAENDAQIISVFCHEIGHVHERHALRMALESSSVALLASVTLGDASQSVALASALPAIYANARYSRSHETEADMFALEYLARNGIARHHFADILRLLQKRYGSEADKGALTHLASHPPTDERVQRFED